MMPAHTGEAHARARLTDRDVADIRRRYIAGTNDKRRGNSAELAAEYGVSQTYITVLAKHGRQPTGDAVYRRCRAAGLSPEAARKVAAHPAGGPASIGPGVVVSVFNLDPPEVRRG